MFVEPSPKTTVITINLIQKKFPLLVKSIDLCQPSLTDLAPEGISLDPCWEDGAQSQSGQLLCRGGADCLLPRSPDPGDRALSGQDAPGEWEKMWRFLFMVGGNKSSPLSKLCPNLSCMQGRLFTYDDTHRHRLGPNFHQIPVNCPYATRARNYQRDGFMTIDGNQGPVGWGHSSVPLHPTFTTFTDTVVGLCFASTSSHKTFPSYRRSSQLLPQQL